MACETGRRVINEPWIYRPRSGEIEDEDENEDEDDKV
jgi:hypothetical protein